MSLALFLYLIKKLSYFIIFEPNNFPKSIEFNTEKFILIFLILFNVLKLEIQHFFKLFPHLIKLLIMLIDGFKMLSLLPLNDTCKPLNFLILFLLNLSNLIGNNTLHSFLLMNSLPQLPNLKHKTFLFISKFSFNHLNFPLQYLWALLFYLCNFLSSLILSFLGFSFPSINLLLKCSSFSTPILSFILLLL